MLAARNRLRHSGDFTAVVRLCNRARRGTLVVHQLQSQDQDQPRGYSPGRQRDGSAGQQSGQQPARVGLIVGKNVGGSVVRHQVSRRLRAQLAMRLAQLPVGSATVVRALAEAAGASSADLGRDLDRALQRLGN